MKIISETKFKSYFANLLKAKRLELGYTQVLLGRKIGVSGACICQYEHKKGLPTLKVLIKIAKVLNISTIEIGANK